MTKPLILVVEDQVLLRTVAISIMEDASFDAIGAKDAEEAIAILEERPEVSVVFTDVDLGPGRTGLWLSSQVKERWPGVQVILTSGYGHIAEDNVPEGTPFFEKPYPEEAVVEEVRRAVLEDLARMNAGA